MENGIKYYPKEKLVLQEAAKGASLWSVSLENTQLTYFEVAPNCIFNEHSHQSEQITMVLEGELYFKLHDKTVCVKQGEVIAIPSNAVHCVFTKVKSVKAVDSWSPVMKKYKQTAEQSA